MAQAIRGSGDLEGLLRPSTEYHSARRPDKKRTKYANYTIRDSSAKPHSDRRQPLHEVSLRFVLINMLAVGLLCLAWMNGYVEKVLVADETKLSVLIFIVFLGGLLLCGFRAFQIGADLSDVEFGRVDRAGIASRILDHDLSPNRSDVLNSVRMELTQRIVLVRYLANALVLLGLIGTVVGFIIALSSIDAERAKDVDAIAPMVTGLISGMSTALYTTLVGAVLNLWLMANYQVLAHGTVNLLTRLTDFGRANA